MFGNIILPILVFLPMAGALISYLTGRKNKAARDNVVSLIAVIETALAAVGITLAFQGVKMDFFLEGFCGFGLHTIAVDGHNFDELEAAFAEAKTVKGKPTAIVMTTTKGKGVSFMENNAGWHGKSTNPAEFEIAMGELKAALAELEA